MVQLSPSFLSKVQRFARKRLRGTFLDKVHFNIQAGNGGMGNPKIGGIGGKGGDVYMEASTGVKDFIPFVKEYPDKRIKAGHGGNATGKRLIGTRGEDVIVQVPRGVRAITDDKLILGEVNNQKEKVILARGGIGGNAATAFCGSRGQRLNVTLELSLIADVGLLGFPNAGKSSLLKACSNAKPKIADYPFTTIKPKIGMLQYKDYREISMADLPGLIEGAHANFGMGHKFLRHIERTFLVLMVVDVNGFQLSHQYPKRSCFETILLLNKELELFDANFLDKPMALVINKMDLPGANEMLVQTKDKLSSIEEISRELPEEMKCSKYVNFEEVFAISAKNGGEEIESIKSYVRSSLENHAQISDLDNEAILKLQNLKENASNSGPLLI